MVVGRTYSAPGPSLPKYGVPNAKGQPGIGIVFPCVFDTDRREVHTVHFGGTRHGRYRRCKMACAAADIQNTFAISGSDEVKKGQGQASAPTTHVQLIPLTIRCDEG